MSTDAAALYGAGGIPRKASRCATLISPDLQRRPTRRLKQESDGPRRDQAVCVATETSRRARDQLAQSREASLAAAVPP